MRSNIIFCSILTLFLSLHTPSSAGEIFMHSPSGKVKASFLQKAGGNSVYKMWLGNDPVLNESRLGIKIKDNDLFNTTLLSKVDSQSQNYTWKPVWGEEATIKCNYTEYIYTLVSTSNQAIYYQIQFRLFDDGMGFRYVFPRQSDLAYFIITDELTTFDMTGDHSTFWIPGDYDSNEFTYLNTRLSEVDRRKNVNADAIFAKTSFSNQAVQTPLMMKSANGIYINIHEAGLRNYPAMDLDVDIRSYILSAHLVPDPVGNKAYMQTPCQTPWRTIVCSRKATDILSSRLILNLNDPAPEGDYSWIKPMKYIGIWWDMHVGTASWNYADTSNLKLSTTDWAALKPNGKHGANNKKVREYIDFAAKYGFKGILVEGWNIGWEDWFGKWKEEVFDFVTPYPDFDIAALNAYAHSKGVSLIMHHETSASVTNYERCLDTAIKVMKQYGYPAAKTGYVGYIIPRGEHHDGQWMVNHYERVAKKFMENKLMLDAHEPVRPTGLQRTYPNWLACEAARGQEFNAWSSGNPPEHETILPFTRLMGGPMDYTPGVFQTEMSYYDKNKKERVHTTLTKQLALYLTLYSPLQMAADLIENYERFPDAFQFIVDVPVEWQKSIYLDAEPGDFLYVARKDKYGDNWYIGCITDENPRNTKLNLSFLDPGKTYIATIYADAKDAHYINKPQSYKIEKFVVNSKSVIPIRMAASGGTAISIKVAGKGEQAGIKNISAKSAWKAWESR
ncbi:MAG TPA: glycoside hydrolase family 97 protein [Saprospiraceae bacterium]|nr:glycoside hydrolase family 97 protein [Saprospiraceae bacterium]